MRSTAFAVLEMPQISCWVEDAEMLQRRVDFEKRSCAEMRWQLGLWVILTGHLKSNWKLARNLWKRGYLDSCNSRWGFLISVPRASNLSGTMKTASTITACPSAWYWVIITVVDIWRYRWRSYKKVEKAVAADGGALARVCIICLVS